MVLSNLILQHKDVLMIDLLENAQLLSGPQSALVAGSNLTTVFRKCYNEHDEMLYENILVHVRHLKKWRVQLKYSQQRTETK